MKNITVTVSDELYHAARIKAAEQHTTVSAIVREHLQEFASVPNQSPQSNLIEALEEFHRKRKGARFDASQNLSRDELYERRR